MLKIIKIIGNIINGILLIFIYFAVIDFIIFKSLLGMGWGNNNGYDCFGAAGGGRTLHPYAHHISYEIAQSYKNQFLYNPQESLLNNIKKDDIKVAFFAGSTGLSGNPRIADALEPLLSEKFKRPVKVVNFSTANLIHNQFMHMLPEFFNDEFKPDIIIYYIGSNEFEIPETYDPRIGNPVLFLSQELPIWQMFILKYLGLFGELDKRKGIISGRYKDKIAQKIGKNSQEWIDKVIYNFFNVIEMSEIISHGIKPDNFKEPYFVVFFQPFECYEQNDKEVINLFNYYVSSIEKNIPKYTYIHDVHNEFNDISPEYKDDYVHVHGYANEKMAKTISEYVYNDIINNKKYSKYL